jgi:putative transposase
LIKDLKPKVVLADKGYDSDQLVKTIEESGSIPVIPPRRNRKVLRFYDTVLYKKRNLIERMFNRLKQFRRVATRYDKTASSFMSFVLLAGIYLWLV